MSRVALYMAVNSCLSSSNFKKLTLVHLFRLLPDTEAFLSDLSWLVWYNATSFC